MSLASEEITHLFHFDCKLRPLRTVVMWSLSSCDEWFWGGTKMLVEHLLSNQLPVDADTAAHSRIFPKGRATQRTFCNNETRGPWRKLATVFLVDNRSGFFRVNSTKHQNLYSTVVKGFFCGFRGKFFKSERMSPGLSGVGPEVYRLTT